MTPEERAEQALDKWVRDMNEVAMSSHDPAYLERLKRNYTESRLVADAMLAILAQAIREARIEAYDEAEKKLRALPRYDWVSGYVEAIEDGSLVQRDETLAIFDRLKDSLVPSSQ